MDLEKFSLKELVELLTTVNNEAIHDIIMDEVFERIDLLQQADKEFDLTKRS